MTESDSSPTNFRVGTLDHDAISRIAAWSGSKSPQLFGIML
jgi:hypothetical protein